MATMLHNKFLEVGIYPKMIALTPSIIVQNFRAVSRSECFFSPDYNGEVVLMVKLAQAFNGDIWSRKSEVVLRQGSYVY